MQIRALKYLSILPLFFASLSALNAESFPFLGAQNWELFGRAEVEKNRDSLTVKDGFFIGDKVLTNADLSFKMRAPKGAKTVQLWAGFGAKDRDNRYIVGLRGEPNKQIYLARIGSNGNSKFLTHSPIDFELKPGETYTLRVKTLGNRIHVYFGDEDLPRINVEDNSKSNASGRVVLGGGYMPAEFLQVEARELEGNSLENFKEIKNQKLKSEFEKSLPDREKARKEQRASYKPVKVDSLRSPRTEISLEGDWLFMPEIFDESAFKPETDDSAWHVMRVPEFWTPALQWLHGESQFHTKNSNDVAVGKGASDKTRVAEFKRVNSYTFDWRQTYEAVYRQKVILPKSAVGKKAELVFDGIAKIGEIWINGHKVGDSFGMFGQVRCDATKYIKEGENLIAVKVVRGPNRRDKDAGKIISVAISVEVTNEMALALPRDFYTHDPAGIWQPAKLILSDSAVSVTDIFAKPKTDGATFEVELSNNSDKARKVELGYSISPAGGGDILDSNKSALSVEVPANSKKLAELKTPELSPKLWTPDTPNLYEVSVSLAENGKVCDKAVQRFGFRTFETQNEKLLLNGKPIWLRGANHFPHGVKYNDAKLAKKFVELAKAGNVNSTRLVCGQPSEIWMNETDEQGVMVSVEGFWPWLFLKEGFAGIPKKELIDSFKRDWESTIRKFRNHPSIIIWTINNEMKFYIPGIDKNDDAVLEKLKHVNEIMKLTRATDPTRPIVVDSAYKRSQVVRNGRYEKLMKPMNFDDGDIDDDHSYFGWYGQSFFNLWEKSFAHEATKNRPLISQEMSTGYPNNDDGLPTRSYLYTHYTPQAFIGDYSYDFNDPKYFLDSVSFQTKELAETFRRLYRPNMAGVIHFGYSQWFKDLFFADTIEPFSPYYALKTALQPVLVSAELYGRHFYAGSKIERRLSIANDSADFSDLEAGYVLWSVEYGQKSLISGKIEIPKIPYYSSEFFDASFQMPKSLPETRIDAKLVLKYFAGSKLVSENYYDITLAEKSWAISKLDASKIAIIEEPNLRVSLKSAVDKYALKRISPEAENLAGFGGLVIIGEDKFKLSDEAIERVKKFVKDGGKLAILNAGALAKEMFPNEIANYRSRSMEVMNFKVPEHAIFKDLKPMDIRYFGLSDRRVPCAAVGYFHLKSSPNVSNVAETYRIHGYMQKPDDINHFGGSAVCEIKCGKGSVLISLAHIQSAGLDPIAAKLLDNILKTLK